MDQSVQSPIEIMYQREEETPSKVFLRQSKDCVWTEYTWEQVTGDLGRFDEDGDIWVTGRVSEVLKPPKVSLLFLHKLRIY